MASLVAVDEEQRVARVEWPGSSGAGGNGVRLTVVGEQEPVSSHPPTRGASDALSALLPLRPLIAQGT